MVESVVEELARKRLGRTIKAKWRLDRLIGVGGMAAVYAATHRNGARVAIKMLHPTISASQQIRARFIREGYLANKVDHPGVVRVLDDDIDETDQSAFLVMDLIIGTTLAERAMERLLDAGEVLDVADQVLQVLQAAHDKAIVHRDLKPDNLLVDKDGKIHVLDFGIARLLDDVGGGATSTKTGTAFGTPGFMAPEQALGKTALISPRTDLYALGATLFALVCGDFVHPAENPQELMVLVATQPARSLGELAPTMHPEVVAIIDRATRNAPEDRWDSATSMLAAVRKLRDKLGVQNTRVLPLDMSAFTPPPMAAPVLPPMVETPKAPPSVPPGPLAHGERNSHPEAMSLEPAPLGSPFAVVSPPPTQTRKPRFMPLAIVGGGAAVLALVAIMFSVGSRGAKPNSGTGPTVKEPEAKAVESTPAPPVATNDTAPPPSASTIAAVPTGDPPGVASTKPSATAVGKPGTTPTIKTITKPSTTGPAPKSTKGIDLGY